MTGATHWLAVGGLEIGTYMHPDGTTRLVCRGETTVDAAPQVLAALRAVTTCGQHAPCSPATADPTNPQQPLGL